jgi:uncharacterized protein
MNLFRVLRSPWRWIPALAAVTLASIWIFSPTVRLAVRGVGASSIGKAQLVDAHIYDGAWFDAARAGRIDILAALLDAGYPVNARTAQGYTATILAAYDEQPAALDYLLSRGADPCVGDHNGNTALMGALYKGEIAIARRVLKTACPIDQTNNAGETALSFAVMFGRLSIIQDLVDRGADSSHRDGQGDTPYAIAEKQGNQESMRALRRIARGY